MKIVVTGGGSGGHITPLLAVAHQLKVLQPDVNIEFVGQTGDSLGDIPAGDANIDHTSTVRAGKFRRYHGEGIRQVLDIPTLLKNLRDAVWVVVGVWQSFWLLRRLKPAAVFIKGGFVGVPVGWAAAMLRIPYITHDSDALPGLANRMVAPWARVHTVALPKEVYRYPANRTVTVGVPISHEYKPVSMTQQKALRHQLGLGQFDRVVLVVGGGLGALRLNTAALASAEELLRRYPKLAIVLLAGRAHEATVRQDCKKLLPPELQKRVVVKGFITNLHQYSGVADVVVTRAGGTAMAEFAAQAKPCVIVPNPLLAGGHQLKNAQVLQDRKAVKMVREDTLAADSRALLPPLVELLDSRERAEQLGAKLHTLAQPDAAKRLAVLLLKVATKTYQPA